MRTVAFALILCLSVSACASKEKQVEELLSTARFEEKQMNREHAVKLYREILQIAPESKVAGIAKDRLRALQ